MKRILISAFEPFGGENRNASLEALERVSFPDNTEICTLEVPTVFGLAGETLLKAVKEMSPEVVICLGQATGRSAITPERVAINIRDASIPDNAGIKPQDDPVVPDGPAALFSTLPIKTMVEASLREGIAASVSNSAGTFVCNDLMYTLLYWIQKDCPGIQGGFIHVPAFAPNPKDANMPYMPLDDIVKGLEAMFRTVI